MLQLAGDLRLLEEAAGQLALPLAVFAEHLDGHVPFQGDVAGAEDHAHAAPTQPVPDHVAGDGGQVFPEISGAAGWLLAGIVGAHFWGAVSRGLQRVEKPLRRRLGVAGDGCAEVVRNWSLALFAAVASLGSALVITTTLTTVFALPTLLNVSPADLF